MMCLQGDECAERDAMELQLQLDNYGSGKVEIEGGDVTVTPNMVDIKKESRSGGYVQPATSAIAMHHLHD